MHVSCDDTRLYDCSDFKRQVMPPGFKYFDRDFMKENEERYRDRIIIVHNNWVIGHDAKVIRFIDHRMWDVEHWDFPSCQ